MFRDIERFTGSWVSSSGHRLEIVKTHKTQALVAILGPLQDPIERPYMHGDPSVRMVAHYDEYNGTFEVDLWDGSGRFILDLDHEDDYEMDEEGRESLVPGIVRDAEAEFLDPYWSLYGPLEHFVRARAESA